MEWWCPLQTQEEVEQRLPGWNYEMKDLHWRLEVKRWCSLWCLEKNSNNILGKVRSSNDDMPCEVRRRCSNNRAFCRVCSDLPQADCLHGDWRPVALSQIILEEYLGPGPGPLYDPRGMSGEIHRFIQSTEKERGCKLLGFKSKHEVSTCDSRVVEAALRVASDAISLLQQYHHFLSLLIQGASYLSHWASASIIGQVLCNVGERDWMEGCKISLTKNHCVHGRIIMRWGNQARIKTRKYNSMQIFGK